MGFLRLWIAVFLIKMFVFFFDFPAAKQLTFCNFCSQRFMFLRGNVMHIIEMIFVSEILTNENGCISVIQTF